jgi:hypothetical protein
MDINKAQENQLRSSANHQGKYVKPEHLICRGLALLVSLPLLFVAAIYYGWINP